VFDVGSEAGRRIHGHRARRTARRFAVHSCPFARSWRSGPMSQTRWPPRTQAGVTHR
jgi:hypothetical protein